MLGIWLELCRRHGISDVLVNTHAHASAVIEFIHKWRDGIRVEVVEEPQLFGSAGTLRHNRRWVQSEQSFWVFYADVLTSADLNAMLRSHNPNVHATLGLYSVPDPERCGIATVDEQGIVIDFKEKPAHPRGNLAFAGVMIGTPSLLAAIPEKPVSDIAFDVLPRLIGNMRAYQIPEYVLDIGTPENYQLAQSTWPGLNRNPDVA
jgi:mannose-1-phosphate guanylyltransferase